MDQADNHYQHNQNALLIETLKTFQVNLLNELKVFGDNLVTTIGEEMQHQRSDNQILRQQERLQDLKLRQQERIDDQILRKQKREEDRIIREREHKELRDFIALKLKPLDFSKQKSFQTDSTRGKRLICSKQSKLN